MRFAYGYHGTEQALADTILRDGFIPSTARGDWLGQGIYFWQDAPLRAWEWARTQYGPNIAVIRARIRLDDCIDLLDIHWEGQMRRQFQALGREYQQAGKPPPTQRTGYHVLDKELIDRTVRYYATKGIAIRCVRAAFVEGTPMFPTSALYDRAHVQIAVIDPQLITGIVQFRLP